MKNLGLTRSIFCMVMVVATVPLKVLADESLETCKAEKNRQMQLTRSIKLAPEPRIDPYTHRSYSSFNKIEARSEVDRIDEWLWKECRSYSEEMHTIEQQYM